MTKEDTVALRTMLAAANEKGAGPWRITDRGDFWSFSRGEENEAGHVGDDCPSELIVALLNAAPDLLDQMERYAEWHATALKENDELVADLNRALGQVVYWKKLAFELGEGDE